MHFSDFGGSKFDPHQPHNIFPFFFSSLFRLTQEVVGSILHKPILFLLIYLFTFSPIQEVLGSVPTHHIYFSSFIFLLTLSSIQEVVGLNPHFLTLFNLHFLYTFSFYQEVGGSNPTNLIFIISLFHSSPLFFIHPRGCGF